jgi:hypothetical protein
MHVVASHACDVCIRRSLCGSQPGRVANPAAEMWESESESKAESKETKVGGVVRKVVERGRSRLGERWTANVEVN